MPGPSVWAMLAYSLATGSRSVDEFSRSYDRQQAQIRHVLVTAKICGRLDGNPRRSFLFCLVEVLGGFDGPGMSSNPGVRFQLPCPPSRALLHILLEPVRCNMAGGCTPSPAVVCMYLHADPGALACFVAYLFVGQTELTVSFLTEAVRVLTSGCRERSLALGGSAAGASDIEGVEAVLKELQTALAEEMALSVAVIRQEEEKAAAAAGAAANVSHAATRVAHHGRTRVLYNINMISIIAHQYGIGFHLPPCACRRGHGAIWYHSAAVGAVDGVVFLFFAVVMLVVFFCRKTHQLVVEAAPY